MNYILQCSEFIPQLCIQLTKAKYVTDDKLIIQLCTDLFFISFINSTFKHKGDALLKKRSLHTLQPEDKGTAVL
jgi:hypothetical protein